MSYPYRYVDVILQLIDKAGDFVSDDIWYRVVQFVTNNEDLQVFVLLVLFWFFLAHAALYKYKYICMHTYKHT